MFWSFHTEISLIMHGKSMYAVLKYAEIREEIVSYLRKKWDENNNPIPTQSFFVSTGSDQC